MALLCWAVLLLAGLACSSAELGSQISIEEYPSIAQVENLAGDLWVQHCAASVLTSYHVLSTAQCFSGVRFTKAKHLYNQEIIVETSDENISVLCTLAFLASGSYQKILCENAGTYISQASASRAIRTVVDALNHPVIINKYIRFPQNANERQILKENNYSDRSRRIRAGTSYRGTEGLVREVYRVYIHPNFGELENDADIAVVRLQDALTLGDTIKQALILGEGIYLPTGLRLTLVSWGTTSEGGLTSNKDLYELNLYTIADDDCLETYLELEDVPNNTITENMFCVGLRDSQGRDLDSKDVGAPLLYDGVTMGVVSFGVSDGEDSVPVVSTAIASYSNWIVETARY